MKKWIFLLFLFNINFAYAEVVQIPIKSVMADSEVSVSYQAANLIDGNVNSYWEGKKKGDTITIEPFNPTTPVSSLEFKLPEEWPKRNQSFTIDGTDNGVTYRNIVPTANYEFDPGKANSKNSATATFATISPKFIKITCQENSEIKSVGPVKSCQIAEIILHGEAVQVPPVTPPITPPAIPPTTTTQGIDFLDVERIEFKCNWETQKLETNVKYR